MATRAQIAANRRNAQASTGPRTDDGKARTRQNALRHGLCAPIPLMHDELEEDVQLLLDTLLEEHQPVGATEEILVYKMAEHFFYCKRASYLLSEKFTWADHGDVTPGELSLLLRYHTTADRGYYKALNELRKIQRERRAMDSTPCGIGSVPQNAQPAPATRKSPGVSPGAHPIPSFPAAAVENQRQPALHTRSVTKVIQLTGLD